MESNICLGTLCGEPYPFVKYRPDRDNKSVSHIGDSSRKDEHNNKIPIDDILHKD